MTREFYAGLMFGFFLGFGAFGLIYLVLDWWSIRPPRRARRSPPRTLQLDPTMRALSGQRPRPDPLGVKSRRIEVIDISDRSDRS